MSAVRLSLWLHYKTKYDLSLSNLKYFEVANNPELLYLLLMLGFIQGQTLSSWCSARRGPELLGALSHSQ